MSPDSTYTEQTLPAGTRSDGRVAVEDLPAPYDGPRPQDALPELFIQDGYANDDPRLWVPLAPGRWSRPLCLNVSNGYWVHLTKVVGGGLLSRHRHPAPVHGFVIKGRWRYLERDWIAEAGSYLYEPPGDIHTLVVEPDCDEMITLFHNTGALIYCDADGNTVGTTDVFDRVDACRKHFIEVGLGADYVEQFIR
tara:strand:- start:152 stop:733 length:582 start_codon:yes stop_codon:yes gene_type:complete